MSAERALYKTVVKHLDLNKLTNRTKFELNISVEEFESKFHKNVSYKKISFFSPPIINNGIELKKFNGSIENNNFTLKKTTTLASGLNLETYYGYINSENNRIHIFIKARKIQGFSLLIFLVFILQIK